MDTKECWRLLEQDFPRELREELVRAAITTYPAAWEAVQSYTKETAKWFQPYQRHALMRDALIGVGGRFDSAKVSVVKTDPPTTDFVELTSGGSAITIATSIQQPRDLPRWARHRATRAAILNADLFQKVPRASGIYAVLLCGPEVTFGPVQHAPWFVDLGVPARDYDTYFAYRPLYDEFPQAVGEILGVTPAEIQEAYLRMQWRRKAEGEDF